MSLAEDSELAEGAGRREPPRAGKEGREPAHRSLGTDQPPDPRAVLLADTCFRTKLYT